MIVRRRRMARRMVGVAATTAVVAGTAGAVRHSQDQKYANQAAAEQAQQAPQSVEAAPAGEDINTQLQQLAQMHNAGVLTDAEFAQAKAKLLGS